MKHTFLISTILVQLGLCGVSVAGERTPLEARAEGNWRLGSERSILMTEFWVPFAQNIAEGHVFYGDLRMMGDDQDNREFNVGAGYRAILHDVSFLGDGIAGGTLWYDRRLTERGSAFNQITLGGEWLADDWDIRANAYIPLNDSETYTQVNPNGSGAGFVGTQVLINTDQTVQEEALAGLDLELGYKIDFMDEYTDSTRVYAAGYHFDGDRAEDISGWRMRVASDITSDVQVGARFQRDDVRGSQGFLEATVRFPFGQKKSFKRDGLYARLDESPERDIDIVSNNVVVEEGNNAVLLNASTGAAQNIVHVDNTAAGGGDGSFENPYNTLAGAEGVAGANDIIYVHTGVGTAGQNAGITLDDPGQMLIGAGTSLVFDGSRFGTSNGNTPSGAARVLIPASTAPVITNGGGNGVVVSASDVYIAGLTVDGATVDGINAINGGGGTFNLTLDSVSLINNGSDGLDFRTSGGTEGNLIVRNSTLSDNAIFGSFIRFDDGGEGHLTATGNTASGNTRDGIRALATNTADATMIFTNNVTNMNTETGLYTDVSGSGNKSIIFTGNTANGNTTTAIAIRQNGATNVEGVFENNTGNGNGEFGAFVFLRGTGTADVEFTDNTFNSNTRDGIRTSTRDTVAGTFNLTNNTTNMNSESGLNLRSEGPGTNHSVLSGNTANNNTDDGLFLRQIDGVLTAKIESSVFTGNASNGIQISDGDAVTQTDIDLGGGTYGSAGQNNFSGNTLEEIRIDVDGLEVKAENNWWGSASGLLPGEVDLDSGTIDANPFLISAP